MPPPPLNPSVSKLFNPIDPIYNKTIARGSLITFNYSLFKHDPTPLVIITDVFNGTMIRGVNLHYLTFPYIRNILKTGCEKQNFSYAVFKGDIYIVNAFRSYKWAGVRNIKKLDCDFILRTMGIVRSFDPSQVKAIRQAVQEQINTIVNPKV